MVTTMAASCFVGMEDVPILLTNPRQSSGSRSAPWQEVYSASQFSALLVGQVAFLALQRDH